MGNILKSIVNSVSGGAIERVVDRVLPERMSEEEKRTLSQEMELELLRSQTDIIQAEAQSDDRYVSRARPTFLYIGYLVLIFNFILLPLLQFATGSTINPIIFPEGFWYLFGTGYLGYTGFRSADKAGWMKSFSK